MKTPYFRNGHDISEKNGQMYGIILDAFECKMTQRERNGDMLMDDRHSEYIFIFRT